MYDRWRTQRAQLKHGTSAHPWEAKGGLLYHIDLGLDLVIRVRPLTGQEASDCPFLSCSLLHTSPLYSFCSTNQKIVHTGHVCCQLHNAGLAE